jgi:pantoate--beta-alanine ligase
MIIAKTIDHTREAVNAAKRKGKSIGFVPTMGALHDGHLSLVRRAKRDTDFVVASIFVNPAQFGPGEDLKKYPRPFGKDKTLLIKEGVDLLFFPGAGEIYAADFSTYVEERCLSKPLCGASRPGHFNGVCTVVAKLFNIIRPNTAYFGAKDYQQLQVIKRMARDLNFSVKIEAMPIVREPDGLAMSSRNAYLNREERRNALCLDIALREAKRAVDAGVRESGQVISLMKTIVLSHKNAKIDYIEIMDADSLTSVEKMNGKVLIALAVVVGKTRLIDNLVIKIPTR